MEEERIQAKEGRRIVDWKFINLLVEDPDGNQQGEESDVAMIWLGQSHS